MKPSDVVRCLRRLHSLYPDVDVAPETMARYAEMLCDLTLEALHGAMERHAATSRFWPSVSQLRSLAVEDASVPPAEVAWGEVIRTVHRVGRYGKPDWSHPCVGAAVEAIGGWQRICDDDSDGVLRAHFYRTFNAYSERAARDANYAGLPSVRRAEQLSSGTAVTAVLELVGGEGTE